MNPHTPSDTSDNTPFCLVYCIFRASDGPGAALPAGVDGHPVYVVEGDGLGAAVSRADRTAAHADVPRVLAYEGVVEACCGNGAVLPMRYGCFLAGDPRVVALLRERRREYTSALGELAGCAEMGVRVLLDHEAGRIPEAPPAACAPVRGTAYLMRRRAYYGAADRISEQQAAVEDMCRTAFSGLFVRCRAEHPPAAHSAAGAQRLCLHFLVKREDVDAFRHAFGALGERAGAKMLLSGPWPPYNFVPPGSAGGE